MDTPETTAKGSTLWTALRAGAAFAAAFLLTAALIHAAVPNPLRLYATMRSEKLLLLEGWQSRVSSALFGASHAHNGFDPRTFDRTLANTPLRTTTLNLGIEGGSQTEERVMAMEYLRHLQPHPDQACFVILDINAGANFGTDHTVHPRSINIYDWQAVRFVRELSPPSLGRLRSSERVGFALLEAGLYYANVGMLSNAIYKPPLDRQNIDDETADDRRGYLTPYTDSTTEAATAREYATIPHTMVPKPQSLVPGNYTLIASLEQASPRQHVHFAYYVSPVMTDLRSYPSYPPSLEVNGAAVPIFSMARPDLYPDLYDVGSWHDDAHLSARGSALLGKHLAEQMLAWYAAHPQDMTCGN